MLPGRIMKSVKANTTPIGLLWPKTTDDKVKVHAMNAKENIFHNILELKEILEVR